MTSRHYSSIVVPDKWGLSYDELLRALHQFDEHMRQTRYNSKGNPQAAWELTFNQWMRAWQRSGHYHQRGARRGGYVMARLDPTQPWNRRNIHIIAHQAAVTISNSRNKPHAMFRYYEGDTRTPQRCPFCERQLSCHSLHRHLRASHAMTTELIEDLYKRLSWEKQQCKSSS